MKTIPLKGKHGDGKFALVDDEDFERLSQFSWCVSTLGYAVFSRRNGSKVVTTFMHLLVVPKADNKHVDHINRDKLDNRKENLRSVPVSVNIHNSNRTKISKSGYRGVSQHTQTGRWRARIKVRNVTHEIGFFGTPEEASAAYENYRKKLSL